MKRNSRLTGITQVSLFAASICTARVWGVRLLPGRVEKVTLAGGKVVQVRG